MAKSIKSQKVFAEHWTQGSSVHCVFQDMGEGARFEPATVGMYGFRFLYRHISITQANVMAISFQKWHIVHSFSCRRCFINESGQIRMTITQNLPKFHAWLRGNLSFQKMSPFPGIIDRFKKTGHWRCLHARDLCSGLCCLATRKDGRQLQRNCAVTCFGKFHFRSF